MIKIDKNNKIMKCLEIPIVLLILSILLAVVYFPLLGNMDRYVISGEPDGFAYWAWRNWMASGFIDSLLENRADPVKLVFYGILINNTIPESGNILDIIFISYPLRKIFGFPASYNLKILLILLFNGFAGYFVISRLLKNPWIAITCGTFIMLNPIVFFAIHKARLRDAIMGFAILYLYYLYKAASTMSRSKAILAGIFLGLTSVFYWFYGMFCIWITIAVIITVSVQLIIRKNKDLAKRFFKNIGLGIIITLVIAIPFFIWYTPMYQKVKLLSDVTLFVPYPNMTELFAQPEPFRSSGGFPINLARIILFDSSYASFFPFSIPFVLLGIFAFFRFKKFQLWLLVIMVFFWLYAMGPYLRITPDVRADGYFMSNGNPIKMPYYYFFQYVPVSGRLHHPIEGFVMVTTAFMFLSAMGLEVLWGWMKKYKLVRGMLFSFLFLGVFFHTFWLQFFAAVPVFPNMNILAVPTVYKEMGKKNREGIIELPLDRSPDIRCFYKTYHKQKALVFNPWNMVMLPEEVLPDNQFVWSNKNEFDLRELPVVRSFEELGRKENGSLNLEGLDKLKDRGYKYIFLHERDFVRVEPEGHSFRIRGKEDYDSFKKELEKHFGKPEIKREFHHCLLSLPTYTKRNDYPHYSHEIAVFEIK